MVLSKGGHYLDGLRSICWAMDQGSSTIWDDESGHLLLQLVSVRLLRLWLPVLQRGRFIGHVRQLSALPSR